MSVDYYETGKLAHESVEWNQIFPKAYISQVSWREVLRLGGEAVCLPSYVVVICHLQRG